MNGFRTQRGIHPKQPTGIIVHGLHKSGTMFLYQLFYRLCRLRRMPYYSSNHPVANDDLVTANIDHDFCLCPIRTFADAPCAFSERVRIRRIFQVRDPRDILVSQYFSYGWRHTETGFAADNYKQRQNIQSLSLDEYVLHDRFAIAPLKNRFADLIHRAPCELDTIVKYEQMVTAFPDWLERILPVFEFRMPALVRSRFSLRYRNEFRADSNPSSHKRSVIPGDYRRLLQPKTVAALNEILAPELGALDYEQGYRQQGSAA